MTHNLDHKVPFLKSNNHEVLCVLITQNNTQMKKISVFGIQIIGNGGTNFGNGIRILTEKYFCFGQNGVVRINQNKQIIKTLKAGFWQENAGKDFFAEFRQPPTPISKFCQIKWFSFFDPTAFTIEGQILNSV